MNLSSAVRAAKSVITANSPVLLVGTAIAGVVATGVLAAKGGYKARGIIEAERMKRVTSPEPPFDTFLEYHEEYLAKTPALDIKEQIKLTWLCYAAPAATAASTIAATAGVHLIHNKRHAALGALYAMTTSKLDDVTAKAEELLGPKKAQQLQNEVAQKAVDRNPIVDHEVVITGQGSELFYDDLAGRYFTGAVGVVEKAMSEINLALAESGKASLNDFYDHVGLNPTTLGKELGWSGKPGDRISARFGAVKTPDGRSAVSVTFLEQPTENFDSKH